MTTCRNCQNLARPVPGALYCAECHALALMEIEQRSQTPLAIRMQRNEDKAWRVAGLPPMPWPVAESDWTSGKPNATCPVCYARYHYGAGVPCVHLCSECDTWLCWKPNGETRTTRARVARKCPVCGKILQERRGPYGPWWGCTFISKGHKDNCPGRRKWHDCDVAVEEKPRLGLAVWVAPGRDEMGQALDEQADLADRLEAKEARFRRGWY